MQPTQEALDRLRAIGWPDDDTSRAALAAAQGARLARVVGQHRSAYDVATQADEIIKVQPPLPWTRPRCPPEQRAAAFGRLGMAFGIGFTVAPVMGAWLGTVDLHLPFWVAAGLCAANFCYGWFVLPESLPLDQRTPFSWRRANPLASLKLLRAHPELLGLAGVSFLMAMAHLVYPTTFVLYADYRFGWGLDMVGWTLLLVGLLTIVVQGGLIGRISRALGNRRTLLLGAAAGGVGFAGYALAPTGYWFWAAMPIAALWAIAGPATQAIMTSRVSASEQGRLQGAIGSLNSIAGILGPTLFTQTLAAVAVNQVQGPLAGASFWLASGLVTLAGLLAWRITTRT